jgi:anti-sigma-K factor RskA
MSGGETVNQPPDQDALAFDYVSGVLRGTERREFERNLQQDDALQAQVRFWEEQLMAMTDEELVRQPDPEVWYALKARVNAELETQKSAAYAPRTIWSNWFIWAMPSVAIFVLAACLWLLVPRENLSQPNADYVAVLTDDTGAPQLTVLTAAKGVSLWLKWENLQIAEDKNLQLWAVSKRDGQIRPLSVFAQTDATQLSLSEANWRLIKDASHLILTEEDEGGSPLDEPSDIIVAKGACILIAPINSSI